ncbi:MAG: hypothetical protein CMH13_24125 [Martelella sp.]|nr:hypothetical protein [Martelella sp.]
MKIDCKKRIHELCFGKLYGSASIPHSVGAWPHSAGWHIMVDYDDTFQVLLSELKLEGRYRTIAELERIAGAFPAVLRLRPHNLAIDSVKQHKVTGSKR